MIEAAVPLSRRLALEFGGYKTKNEWFDLEPSHGSQPRCFFLQHRRHGDDNKSILIRFLPWMRPGTRSPGAVLFSSIASEVLPKAMSPTSSTTGLSWRGLVDKKLDPWRNLEDQALHHHPFVACRCGINDSFNQHSHYVCCGNRYRNSAVPRQRSILHFS